LVFTALMYTFGLLSKDPVDWPIFRIHINEGAFSA
jgi:hypothetical protein